MRGPLTVYMSFPLFLGYKDRMTRFFDEKGRAYAVTVVKTNPHVITQVKASDSDGYTAVQIGFDSILLEKLPKPEQGHLKNSQPVRVLSEVVLEPEAVSGMSVGTQLNPLSDLSVGTLLHVAGISKSKGFQGGVKRHGFKGDKRSHGRKHSERKPGSIGGGGRAGGRVAKGMRMAGRMGGDRITVKNVSLIHLDATANELYVTGALPGRRGTLLELYAQK